MSKVYLAEETSSEQTATLGGGLPSGGGGDGGGGGGGGGGGVRGGAEEPPAKESPALGGGWSRCGGGGGRRREEEAEKGLEETQLFLLSGSRGGAVWADGQDAEAAGLGGGGDPQHLLDLAHQHTHGDVADEASLLHLHHGGGGHQGDHQGQGQPTSDHSGLSSHTAPLLDLAH